MTVLATTPVSDTLRAATGWHLSPGQVPGSWLAQRPDPLRPVLVTAAVDAAIRRTVGLPRPEQGGLLGGSRLTGVVDVFEHDATASTTGVSYTPDIAWVNERVRNWRDAGQGLLGFVHSHPRGLRGLSGGDVAYATRLLGHLPRLDRLVLPVVQTARTPGTVEIAPWVFHRDGDGFSLAQVPWLVVDAAEPEPLDHPAFERVRQAYDLPLLARSRVVVVGCGGSTGLVENLARSGVGELVVVDHDRVELANTATQAHSWLDVGRHKVDAAAERARRASPLVRVVTVPASLEALTDSQVEDLLHERLPGRPAPLARLLVGATDSFVAQARLARLGLDLQVPAMAAQVYPHGAGVEVTFAVPGASRACQRCALGPRYRHVAQHGVQDGHSHGTPYSTTARLNALEHTIAIALLHGTAGRPTTPAGAPWRSLFDRIATRNLVQVRCRPDAPLPSLERALAGADQERLVMDETVWLPQEPEGPETGFAPCPDCGGTGDLTAVASRRAPTTPATTHPPRVWRDRRGVAAAVLTAAFGLATATALIAVAVAPSGETAGHPSPTATPSVADTAPVDGADTDQDDRSVPTRTPSVLDTAPVDGPYTDQDDRRDDALARARGGR